MSTEVFYQILCSIAYRTLKFFNPNTFNNSLIQLIIEFLVVFSLRMFYLPLLIVHLVRLSCYV